jgi:hemerythrin-like domain-containing protein
MNVIQLLKQDHEQVRQKLEDVLRAREEFFDLKKLDRACRELDLHMLAEEELLYPRMSDVLQMPQLIRDSFREHSRVRGVIDEIAIDAVDVGRCRHLVQELLSIVEQHIEHEEKQLFPAMERQLSREDLNELGTEIQEYKNLEGTMLS